MANQHIAQRLHGIQTILNGVHQTGALMSASSKGTERQALIDQFLQEILPRVYRFGTGDVTDLNGNKSGQLDVVVEYPFAPSLPSSLGSPRLYLAESLAAVIEVKSNLASQWNEALRTAEQLAPVQRSFEMTMSFGASYPGMQIPLFVVGYTGWANLSTLQAHVDKTPNISGALVINPPLYYCKADYGGFTATGPWALWGLICSLQQIATSLQACVLSPIRYALNT